MKLLHNGSVKDIYQLTDHELLFHFSNRYSIFDWGQMPDEIPGKGAALAKMGCKLLSHLDAKGFHTHFLHAGDRPEDMVVRAVDVPRGHLEKYRERPVNTLVPLEVIYRFGAPKGSSLLRKFKTEAEWKAAGFDRQYHEGEFFSDIVIDVTTKLERLDRPLTKEQAMELASITGEEWDSLLHVTREIAREIQQVFLNAGMKLWDGKFEFAFMPGEQKDPSIRKFMLVDTIGLDEIRLTYENFPLSKELLRQVYLGSDWYTALEAAKKKDPARFKEYCTQELKQAPRPLTPVFLQSIANVYQSVAAMILNQDRTEMHQLHQSLNASLEPFRVLAREEGRG